jgi:protein disulfide-isomerase-like protein
MSRVPRITAYAFFVLLAVAGASAQGKVVTLTDDTFEHQTQASSGQTTGAWFVKFYAPWCGHCRAMAGTWAELAAELQDTGVIIADVDATANPITTDRFNGLVKGFPTLLLFRDRAVFKYKGARDLESLKTFAKETFVEARRNDVPGPPSAFARHFSLYTRALAMFIIDAHGVFESAGKTATRDAAELASGWKKAGFSGLVTSAKNAARASPRTYGAVIILLSIVVVCFAILMALITAPSRPAVKRAKKDN